MFSHAELDFLDDHDLARMATVQPDGTLQVSPVGYRHNREAGPNDARRALRAAPRKLRNVENHHPVAIVIDARLGPNRPEAAATLQLDDPSALLDVFPEDGHL